MITSCGQTASASSECEQALAHIPAEPEAFLRWVAALDRHHPFKYELREEKVCRKSRYVSRGHSRVVTNMVCELVQFDRSHFDVFWSRFGVRTAGGIRYPDVVADRAGGGLDDLACWAPLFIAEVLSPSTMGLDFTAKLQEYSSIASVQTYLICSQDEPRAWVWARRDDGSWPKRPAELVGRDSAIALG